MAMVQPKSQKARLFITHLLLLLFIAAIMFPLLMVVAISLRQGNCDRQPDPGANLLGSLETGIRF